MRFWRRCPGRVRRSRVLSAGSGELGTGEGNLDGEGRREFGGGAGERGWIVGYYAGEFGGGFHVGVEAEGGRFSIGCWRRSGVRS